MNALPADSPPGDLPLGICSRFPIMHSALAMSPSGKGPRIFGGSRFRRMTAVFNSSSVLTKTFPLGQKSKDNTDFHRKVDSRVDSG